MSEKRDQTIPGQEAERIVQAYERRSKSVPPGRYSLFEPSHLLRVQERERRVLKLIESLTGGNLQDKMILEVGCGSGHWLRQFVQWGALPANLAGVDLLPSRLAEARERCPAGVRLEIGDASHLKFDYESFDIILQATAFSSILSDELKAALAREMLRVLRPGGFVLWYDFFVNNPRNPDVRGIGKNELHRLFPNCSVYCERMTLAPPLGRLLGRVSAFAYNLASGLRFLCTHYLAVIKKT